MESAGAYRREYHWPLKAGPEAVNLPSWEEVGEILPLPT